MPSTHGTITPAGLGPGGTWHEVGIAVVRGVVVLGFVLIVYFGFPVGGFAADNPLAAWLRLGAVVITFVLILALELRIVASARAPRIRAVEAVVESVVAFVCLFALLHYSMSTTDVRAFSEPLDRIDALYFTASTLATVGFGDITPTARLSRAVVTVQILSSLGLLFVIAKAAFHAAAHTLHPRP